MLQLVKVVKSGGSMQFAIKEQTLMLKNGITIELAHWKADPCCLVMIVRSAGGAQSVLFTGAGDVMSIDQVRPVVDGSISS